MASPLPPTNDSRGPVSRKWRRAAWVLAALLAVGGGWAGWVWFRGPVPPVTIPAAGAKIDPQVRALIEEKAAAARHAPRVAAARAVLGLVYAANGLWTLARTSFHHASLLARDEPLPLLYYGVASDQVGEPEAALGCFREVTQRFPAFAPGFYRLGNALLKSGQVDEAERAFRRLIVLAPQEWRGYAGLGQALLGKQRFQEAAAELRKAKRLAPDEKIVHHLLGLALRGLRQMGLAEQELRKGLNAVAYPMPDGWSEKASRYMRQLPDQIDLAQGLIKSGNAPAAVSLLEKALRWHPANVAVMCQLAVALRYAGEPERAYTLLQHVNNLQKDYLPAYFALAETCLSLHRTEEALKAADQAEALDSKTAQPFLTKAKVLLALGRTQEALQALESARQRDPGDVQTEISLGDVQLRLLGHRQDALKAYRRANELDPASVPVWLRLADLYLRLNEPQKAASALAQARALSPEDPSIPVIADRLKKAKREKK